MGAQAASLARAAAPAPKLGASATHQRVKQAEADEVPESKPPGRDADKYLGTTIDGRYVVESVIGEGGMGVVYRCRRKIFEKTVALKILRAEVARTPEVLERFVTEAKAASAIGNAHIVEVLDFGEVPDGSTYFAMEYLEGDTLGALLAKGTVLEPDWVLSIGRQIAEGLAAAHDAKIVHRDLKPDNVFVTKKDGKEFVKILDFGIAKVAGLQNKITRAGAVFGTPHYMSPEQCRGTAVDHRTDIYALGVMLYEMLAGRVPFDAENPLSILSMHLNENPKRFEEVDAALAVRPALENLVLKCLAKDAADRFQSMREVEQALAAILRGEDIEIEVPISIAPPPDVVHELLPESVKRGPSSEPTSGRIAVPMAPPVPSPDSMRASFVSEVRASAPGISGAPVSARHLDAELKAAAEAADAEREWARASRKRRWLWGIGAVVVLGAGGAGFVTLSSQRTSTLAEGIQAGRPLAMKQLDLRPKTGAAKKVALVLAPIDAKVYRGGQLLGKMPISVEVPADARVEVEIKRDGYWPRKVTLDGSKDSVTFRLSPKVGSKPPPEPAAGAEAKPSPEPADPGPPPATTITSPLPPPSPPPEAPAAGEEE